MVNFVGGLLLRRTEPRAVHVVLVEVLATYGRERTCLPKRHAPYVPNRAVKGEEMDSGA